MLQTHEAGDPWQFKTSYFQIGSGVDEDDEKDDDDDENDENESEEEEEDGDEVTDDREKQRFNALICSL